MNRRGFSLLEVLIAMAILLIGLVGTTGLVHYAIDRGTNARKLTDAQFVAGQVMERLRLEVRYDATGQTSTCGASSTNHGCIGGSALTDLADGWKAERLPYGPDDTLTGTVPGLEIDCNPTGAQDGQAWDVGPIRLKHEGNDFFVCYTLAPRAAASGIPGGSLDARVKVIWNAGGAYAAHWLGGLLLNGR